MILYLFAVFSIWLLIITLLAGWYSFLIAAAALALTIAAILGVVVVVIEWMAAGVGIFSKRRCEGRFG